MSEYASGGIVSSGQPTWVTGPEFIIPASTVRRLGPDFFKRMNRIDDEEADVD